MSVINLGKKEIFFGLVAVIILGIAIFLPGLATKNQEKWGFVGYQYRWSTDYVSNNDLNSQMDCLEYGDIWLGKQTSPDALFTCSVGCEKTSFGDELVVCDRVCEYSTKGLIRCRS